MALSLLSQNASSSTVRIASSSYNVSRVYMYIYEYEQTYINR